MQIQKLKMLKPITIKLGLYGIVRWLWHHINPTLFVLEKKRHRDFLEFYAQCGNTLKYSLLVPHKIRKRALIVSIGFSGIKVELGLIKSLELAGYEPIVLTDRDPWLVKYYQLAGVRHINFWDEFYAPIDHPIIDDQFANIQSLADLLKCEYVGARVGKYAVSTTLRYLRLGELDLHNAEIRQSVCSHLSTAMEYAQTSRKVVEHVKPDIVLTVDPGYTPRGELYDACLAAGIDSITWNAAHKSNTLMLKRYSHKNRDVHPSSLSDETWRELMEMEWTDALSEQLKRELYNSYSSGDWYSEVGTQFNTRFMRKSELQESLELDPRKKTAFIFPHIFWDGTFFWGDDLFSSYEEWFLETVRAACENDQVNWVIKVHPANIVKNYRDGIQSEPSEVVAIREQIGHLPSNVYVIPAESEINTYSLYSLMDYCVTVRGTVGIEAASFGVPVLTAGTGRYNGKGFTIDSQTREQYIGRVRNIHKVLPLTDQQRELAERFAYGVFVVRPVLLRTLTLEYQQDARASNITRLNVQMVDNLSDALDLRAIAEYITSGQEDFIAKEYI